ncbi:hypothetical protein ARALYDRAFT_889909 [Arabidopsis lyrata subsp. lyrata]|uniref:DUF220 domain-containing protein n=1 Tax=Arabidopsis lyrata subsp. lyrata TaxID=81972 RepID=D7KNH9_ARALL|nr:hypothetical protein ARALYDRAFT_889909 [Arabidopsis lyrata subsp. lyrata]
MSVFPGFGGWINQNSQQPPKAESKRSENVESNSEPPLEFKYYDKDEVDKQVQLWIEEDKKYPWKDAPPKVKVTRKKGLYHMHIELTKGRVPESVYLLFANPLNNQYFQDFDGHNFLHLLESVNFLEGKQIKKTFAEGWTEADCGGRESCILEIPLVLWSSPNKSNCRRQPKISYLFEGSWKVEPLFIDSERLCKQIKPKSREEYKKCSGGRGRIASKVTMEQIFQPSFPLNLPPFSWIIRGITIKTTKNLLDVAP